MWKFVIGLEKETNKQLHAGKQKPFFRAFSDFDKIFGEFLGFEEFLLTLKRAYQIQVQIV